MCLNRFVNRSSEYNAYYKIMHLLDTQMQKCVNRYENSVD